MKVFIAMSGGVDSAVAALMMRRAGHECIGGTMRLFCGTPEESVRDAAAVAEQIGIPFHVLDFTKEFRTEVIDRFVAGYERGETPNPCIDCNRNIKFGKLLEYAAELGCDKLVTGHYARVSETPVPALFKAKDPQKDQSYVLYSLTKEQLGKVVFPLGEFTKAEVKQIAEENGFINARKKESQDICFVPDGDYARVIRTETGEDPVPGEFADRNGKVYGMHKGLIHYTIGQRKGLGLALPSPLYVLEKDVEKNRVILGNNEELFTKEFDAGNVNWIRYSKNNLPERMRVKAKIRYRQTEQWATVIPDGSERFHAIFDEPQRAITKGQAVVLYDGEQVVGGGTIL